MKTSDFLWFVLESMGRAEYVDFNRYENPYGLGILGAMRRLLGTAEFERQLEELTKEEREEIWCFESKADDEDDYGRGLVYKLWELAKLRGL